MWWKCKAPSSWELPELGIKSKLMKSSEDLLPCCHGPERHSPANSLTMEGRKLNPGFRWGLPAAEADAACKTSPEPEKTAVCGREAKLISVRQRGLKNSDNGAVASV